MDGSDTGLVSPAEQPEYPSTLVLRLEKVCRASSLRRGKGC
jgi:hypothetical protein